jgi:NAD(P)-dependent dehydrogenase (short-subunit alcohol dehydrogenase family)
MQCVDFIRTAFAGIQGFLSDIRSHCPQTAVRKSMNSFLSKVVVITGAGSGIGRALAMAFAGQGARLALNDFNEQTLQETVAALPAGTEVFAATFDVSKKELMFQFADDVLEKFGKVDVVINNAGVAIAGFRTDEVSIEDYEWIMGINLWGMIYGSLAFLPHLRKQQESALVNVSSIFGLHGIPVQAPYVTTKFAIRGFTESLALEEQVHGTGVTVSSVHPGGIKTNIARASKGAEVDPQAIAEFEKQFRTTPERAAAIILRGIRKKKSRILVGTDAHIFHFAAHRMRFLLRYFLKRGLKKTVGKA